MSRVLIERKLFDVAQRLKRAREELAVIDEQLTVMADAADDARIRSLVSETPLAQREYSEAQRHADAMLRSRRTVAAEVAELEVTQDELLDRLIGEGSSES
jgi:phage terminase Nu1 subunit (DNA packaging protein)